MLLHHGAQLALLINLVSRPPREQLLIDEGDFVSGPVLQGQLVAEAEDAALDLQDFLAGLISDGELIAEAEPFLLHNVAHLRHLNRKLNVRGSEAETGVPFSRAGSKLCWLSYTY